MIPPYDLPDRVRVIWDETVADLVAMKVGSPADRWQIAAYCEAAALFERASDELRAAELVVSGSRSEVANKLVGIRDRAGLMLLRFAQEFGLTPAARTRVEAHVPGPTDGDNPFAGG